MLPSGNVLMFGNMRLKDVAGAGVAVVGADSGHHQGKSALRLGIMAGMGVQALKLF
ncbi:MAG: hypothetical protein KDA69_00930 [Planctomycetaceae bacterium]|nr:hypothetical protein [Planctomycetaceae bacterium]